ncbi:hypothetical protein JCM8547_002330 [Rhodosporidiobolus lusitaniae]
MSAGPAIAHLASTSSSAVRSSYRLSFRPSTSFRRLPSSSFPRSFSPLSSTLRSFSSSSTMSSTSSSPTPVHLLVTAHGLWGNPSHIEYIKEAALKFAARSADKSGTKLVVLAAKSNGTTWTHTYDGIDTCADRVVEEIDEEVKKIQREGGKVTKFSMVGYSLGGLVARYTIGLLDSRTPSFFDEVEPVNFATFASPAIGIPHYQTFWSRVFRFLGARLLSRSGTQLYEHDSFLPARFNPDRPSPATQGRTKPRSRERERKGINKLIPFASKPEPAEPLLKIMADPKYSFYRALSKFERIEVFANTVNDRTVPFVTGAIEAHDPFALARAKGQKISDLRGDDLEKEADYLDGGLDIKLEPRAPIVSALAYVPQPTITAADAPPNAAMNRFRRQLPKLPMLLKPSTYPFSKPLAILWIASFPISLPLLFTFLVARFSLQGRESRKRIKAAQSARGDGEEGMLARVGIRIAETLENAGLDNPEYAGGLSEPSREDEASRSAATSGTATPVNGYAHGYSKLSTSALSSKSFSTSALSSASSSSSTSSTTSPSPTPAPRSSPLPKRDPFPTPPAEDLFLARRFKTDPLLTPSQKFQLENLNALPQLRKHFVHMPGVRHTHGCIVRRDPRFHAAKYGLRVVDKWAGEARW